MKFLTMADWTGMVESDLFADTYRSYGLATVRYPVLEVAATVEPCSGPAAPTVTRARSVAEVTDWISSDARPAAGGRRRAIACG